VVDDSVLLAHSERSGFVENTYRGTAVLLDASGGVIRAWGNPHRVIYPRSSNKPMQVTGMLRCGLPLDGEVLAVAAASHSGSAQHLEAVRVILMRAGIDERALQTPADFPLGEPERLAWIRSGSDAEPIAMNCSGKHAAMLLTCRERDWSIADYTDPSHPLQQELRATVGDLAGESVAHTGVDGCGAPLFAISIAGMARALQAVLRDPIGRSVADAMRTYPVMAGGIGRDVTQLMQSVPGIVAKDGADGVWVTALSDGTALALKIDDGNPVARRVVVRELLRILGVDNTMDVGEILGGGKPVGRVRAVM
jgi:L-asparaginase II